MKKVFSLEWPILTYWLNDSPTDDWLITTDFQLTDLVVVVGPEEDWYEGQPHNAGGVHGEPDVLGLVEIGWNFSRRRTSNFNKRLEDAAGATVVGCERMKNGLEETIIESCLYGSTFSLVLNWRLYYSQSVNFMWPNMSVFQSVICHWSTSWSSF